MGERDNACSGAASKVRGRAFVMTVVDGPAISTAPIVGAIAGFMPWIFAVTPETIDMRGERAFSLAKRSPWRGSWVLYTSSL